MSALSDARAAASERWRAAKEQHAWLAHLVRAWDRLQANNGSQYAAAITYFSFLALFPLILLAVSVVGFVLHSHPHLQTELFANITKKVPGDFGTTLQKSINSTVDARTGVGIVGLLGLLFSGLGWIGNVRKAIDAVWGVVAPKRNFVVAKLANLLVLAGLGVGILLSLGLATVGTAVTDPIVNAVGLGHGTGVTYLFKALTIVLGVAGDMIIFGWVLVRLPGGHVPRAVALRGALLAAVGFDVLKILGTYTVAKSAQTRRSVRSRACSRCSYGSSSSRGSCSSALHGRLPVCPSPNRWTRSSSSNRRRATTSARAGRPHWVLPSRSSGWGRRSVRVPRPWRSGGYGTGLRPCCAADGAGATARRRRSPAPPAQTRQSRCRP